MSIMTLPPPGDPFHPSEESSITRGGLGAGPPKPERHRTLSEALLGEMARRGMTTTVDLGKALDVAPSTAWRLLKGVDVPRETTLERIARFLDLPITEVRRLADRAEGEAGRFELPRELDQLTFPERELLIRVGRAILYARAHRVTRS